MNRLTENVLGNIQLKACGNDFCKETCAEHDEETSCNNCPIQKAFEKLAEYEDLEEQGRLLKLPCGVGGIVYTIYSDEDGPFIREAKIEEVSIHHRIWVDSMYFDYDDFGKTVFLTRKEAEDRLTEMAQI